MARLVVDAEEHPELVAAIWRRGVGPRRDYLAGVLRRGVAEGLIRPDVDLDLLIDMLVNPVVSRVRLKREPLSDEQVAQVVDIILAGVRP